MQIRENVDISSLAVAIESSFSSGYTFLIAIRNSLRKCEEIRSPSSSLAPPASVFLGHWRAISIPGVEEPMIATVARSWTVSKG
jgi:hypothetical protein